MKNFRQWLIEDLGHSLIPPNLPRTNTSFIGNELRTDSGISSRRFNGESERRYDIGVKAKITELPVPRTLQKGLGDLGIQDLKKDIDDGQQKKKIGHDSRSN